MTAVDIPDSMLYGQEQPTRKPGEFERDSKGTPIVADPAKRRKDGQPWSVRYGRPSGFGKQIENTYNLDKWNERQIVLGVAFGTLDCTPLVPPRQDDREWRSLADGLVVEAKRKAKAMLAAERGSHTHLLAELDDEGEHWLTQAEAGEDLGLPTEVQAALVEAWRTMLAVTGLEVVANEATVVNDRWRLAGTLDRIARLTRDMTFTTPAGELVTLSAGDHIVLDIKTGKLTADDNGYPRYWHTYAVQVCAYADAVPYDPDTGQRGVWPFTINPNWAVIAHLDVLAALEGEATCTPILVDIAAGRAAGELCHQAKQWQKRDDIFGRLHNISEPADDTRERLRTRVRELVEQGHEDRLRMAWPQGVAPLSQPGQTDADLALILEAVRRVESDVSATFHPDDAPAPANPAPDVEDEAFEDAPPDEGGWIDAASHEALQRHFAALSEPARQAIGVIGREANAAGRPISVTQSPTVRRWSIARALVRWAEAGADVGHLWYWAAVIAEPDQARDPDQSLGALIGSFTIEQANTLHDALDTPAAA